MRKSLLVLGALAVSTIGCKVKVDAKPVGFKEGSADTVVVHVVTSGGAELTCSDDACARTKVPSSGAVDLDVRIPPGSDSKRVFLHAKLGPRKGDAMLDLATAVPPKLSVAGDYGSIGCEPRKCNGFFKLVPTTRISMSADPGTVLEVGTEKFTVPADGFVEAPITLVTSPSLDRIPLAKICVGLVSGATPPRPFATVTMTATFPDKVKSSTKAQLDLAFVERSLAESLRNVTKGPVAFPWEKGGAPAAGKRAAIYADGSNCYDAGAGDAVLGDLDVVAVSEGQERVGECTYTSASNTTTGTIKMHDENATAYDRITGKKLGSRLFLAPKECLKTFYAKPGEKTPDAISFASKEAIAKWAATFAK